MWKGPTDSGSFLHAVDSEYFGPWGAGYIVALGDDIKGKKTGRIRHLAIGHASRLPAEALQFLMGDALPLRKKLAIHILKTATSAMAKMLPCSVLP